MTKPALKSPYDRTTALKVAALALKQCAEILEGIHLYKHETLSTEERAACVNVLEQMAEVSAQFIARAEMGAANFGEHLVEAGDLYPLTGYFA